MRIMPKSKFCNGMIHTVAVVIMAACICMASGASASGHKKTAPTALLVFPVDNYGGSQSSKIAQQLGESITSELGKGDKYRVLNYSENLPGVGLFVNAHPELKQVIYGPFSEGPVPVAKAVMLARELCAETILVGALDKYSVLGNGSVRVLATVQLVDAKAGKCLNTVQVSGLAEKTASNDDLPKLAALDAGGKIAAVLISDSKQDKTADSKQKDADKH